MDQQQIFNALLDKNKEYFSEDYKFPRKKLLTSLIYLDEALSMNFNCNKSSISEAYFLRGKLRLRLHNLEKSIEDFNMAIKTDENNFLFFKYRGMAKSFLNKLKEAIEDYDYAIKLNPNDPELFIFKGHTENDLGNFSTAINNFDNAIKKLKTAREDSIIPEILKLFSITNYKRNLINSTDFN